MVQVKALHSTFSPAEAHERPEMCCLVDIVFLSKADPAKASAKLDCVSKTTVSGTI